jgi:glyoxylase-like metal-dependent hydrolase (beta-lactamase superfamily II)
MSWNVKALTRGTINTDKSIVTARQGMGERIDVVSTVYYLTDGDRNVLIDTGYGDPEFVQSEFGLFEVDPADSLPELLDREAVPPEEIDTVVLSHLHWDHAGNVDVFDNESTEIMVHRDEFQYAVAPPDIHETAFLSPNRGYEPSWDNVSFSFIEGDSEIYPGLTAIETPGHSPAHLSFIVNSNGREMGLPIDLFPLYENIEGTDDVEHVPPGCVNVREWWHSARRFSELADDIIPSHDPDGPSNEWISNVH